MTIIYREEQGDLQFLAGKTVSVIGYGSLGRPVALNLRDSGVEVMIGARGEQTREAALEDGLTVKSVSEVVQQSRIIMMMLPDEVMAQVYLEQVAPHLQRGHTLIFGSAYNITYRFIEPPPFVDVGLLAPRILGFGVRERYEAGEGFYSFVSVGQDSSGQTWNTLLALAKAIGTLRAGAIEISFEQESELDLFMQQAILPALYHIMTTAANLLISRGYPPEALFTELYLSGELAYYMKQVSTSGLLETLSQTTLTNQFGTISRIDRFNDLKMERLMEVTLKEIHSGDFAREWSKEHANGTRRLKNFFKNQDELEIWQLEQQTREMMGIETDLDDEY